MHTSLTEHARCLYGDEYRPVPECGLEHEERCFVEELTFADADSILAMLRELCPHLVDGRLPVWVRNLAYRPSAAASWATTVTPGWRRSASSKSSKPTRATRRPCPAWCCCSGRTNRHCCGRPPRACGCTARTGTASRLTWWGGRTPWGSGLTRGGRM